MLSGLPEPPFWDTFFKPDFVETDLLDTPNSCFRDRCQPSNRRGSTTRCGCRRFPEHCEDTSTRKVCEGVPQQRRHPPCERIGSPSLLVYASRHSKCSACNPLLLRHQQNHPTCRVPRCLAIPFEVCFRTAAPLVHKTCRVHWSSFWNRPISGSQGFLAGGPTNMMRLCGLSHLRIPPTHLIVCHSNTSAELLWKLQWIGSHNHRTTAACSTTPAGVVGPQLLCV
jgi:hypothetical protein